MWSVLPWWKPVCGITEVADIADSILSYIQVPNLGFLSDKLQQYMMQYNDTVRGAHMDLVFFKDAMTHLVKVMILHSFLVAFFSICLPNQKWSHIHTHTHTYVDRHSKWGQHSEDTLKWWFARLSEDKNLPLLFTSVCSPAFPSLNFCGVHASCTLIAIDGAFKFLDRIHPEFSRSFQIVTTLLKKKKNHTQIFVLHIQSEDGVV